MKKLVSIFLALVMILAISVPAFAAEDKTIQLTISGIKDHTYVVFQIYTADVHKNDEGTLVLSNVKYGQNHYPNVGGSSRGDAVPETELKDFQNSSNPANFFSASLQNTNTPYATINKDDQNKESVTIAVDPGYYMIVDDTANLPDGQTASPIILKVAETTTIASKHATISSTKKVADKNDSTDGADWEPVWQDSADYDIGDDVPFRLTVTLPSTLNTYTTYPLVFHDMQADGFQDPIITKVYIERNNAILFEINSGYTLGGTCDNDECDFGDDCSFNIAFTDVKTLYTANAPFKKDDVLVVEYTSKLLGGDANGDRLDDKVNVGRTGNENRMYVHHPDGHTPMDAVTVLTYQLNITKIDGNTTQELAGAGFTLEKLNAVTGNYEPIKVGVDADGNPIYELEGNGMTVFTWSGIDGGKYKLVETTTPDGYNTVADIYFNLDANHKVEWFADGNSAFEDVIAHKMDGTGFVYRDNDGTGVEDGIIEGTVENFQGVVLPETGAMGTMWLIFGGAMLVIVAAVFMITRKRMSVYED